MKFAEILVSCLVVAGCAAEPLEPEVTEVEQWAGASPGDGSCPTWGCGGNTSLMHGIPFIDVNLRGEPNNAGFRIVKFEVPGTNGWVQLTPQVVAAELQGRTRTGAIIKGNSLSNARFEMFNDFNQLTYYLEVYQIEHTLMWAQKPSPIMFHTPAYLLRWRYKPGQYDANGNPLPLMRPTPICGENPDGTSGGGTMADFRAVLFEKDRFDEDAISVTGEDPDWFTIGCAGHALAKQHLLAHTNAGARRIGITPPSVASRTANLKMITADYCGLGHPFTVPGQPLRWSDAGRFYNTVPTSGGEVEARWSANGATCLNRPRVDFNAQFNHTDTLTTFPEGVAALLPPLSYTWCTATLPPCEGTTSELSGAPVISVNFDDPQQ